MTFEFDMYAVFSKDLGVSLVPRIVLRHGGRVITGSLPPEEIARHLQDGTLDSYLFSLAVCMIDWMEDQ